MFLAFAAVVTALVVLAAIVLVVARNRRRQLDEARPHPTVTAGAGSPASGNVSSRADTAAIAAFVADLHATDMNRRSGAQVPAPTPEPDGQARSEANTQAPARQAATDPDVPPSMS